jgi:hypothetical protein
MNEALGIGLGMTQGMIGQAMGMSNSRNLMDKQMQNQMALNKQMQEIQMQNWEKTNYLPQRLQMEKAGLNVGLMYGGSGSGGATMGGGSGGSASGGQNVANAMEIGVNAQQNLAQLELIKAQTEKLKAEATKIEGVDTDLTRTQINGNEIENNFNSLNIGTALEKSKAELNNVNANTEKQVAEGKLSQIDGTTRNWENVSKIVNTMMSTKKMDNEIKQQWTKVEQGWKELELKNKGLNIEQQKTNIQEFGAETQRNYPGLMNVTGNIIEDGIKSIYKMFGVDREQYNTKVK